MKGKQKLQKAKSVNPDQTPIEDKLLNAGQRANILNKQKSVEVTSKQRYDRQGLPIIKIPRSEMESPSKKGKKDDKKKVYKVTFLDKIDKD